MSIVFLVTDAYGGHGGIALFNRQLCDAIEEPVTVIPRVVRGEVGTVPPHVTFVAEAARNPLAYLRALAAARRSKPELVICGHMNLLPVAFGRPLLVVHGIEAWKRRRRATLEKCRGVLSVSAVTRDRLVGWSGYAGPTYVLPNAIRLEQYGIRPKRRDLVERYGLADKRVLLTVGRLDSGERSKGFDEVLDVLRDLPEDVVYVIAGGGNDFPRLQKKTVELGLSRRVVFTGLFEEREKPDLYNLADVYVMPSRGEGFGFVFLEAMACGVPVIGSKSDGGREALRGGELGLLVDPTNPAELRAAIVETLARGERRIPPGLDYFSFEKFVERSRAILSSV